MIGIFGGSFDPIHVGHLRAAIEIKERYNLKSVYFLPCHLHAFRKKFIASDKDRVSMLKLAITNEPDFIIDERELNNDKPSYMIDTLLSFKQELPDEELLLIIGSDNKNDFFKWHRAEEILSIAQVIAVNRDSIQEDTPILEISSTYIRAQIKAKKDIRYLVPDSVFNYIHEHKLYEV
jgi:nicotinate-nucleotide adenylyltransferase